jgi:hypothetical protein
VALEDVAFDLPAAEFDWLACQAATSSTVVLPLNGEGCCETMERVVIGSYCRVPRHVPGLGILCWLPALCGIASA